MDEDTITSNMVRRLSSRTRKVATRMVAALASSGNRTQGALARLEALENYYPGPEMIEIYSDDDASLGDEDQGNKAVLAPRLESVASRPVRTLPAVKAEV